MTSAKKYKIDFIDLRNNQRYYHALMAENEKAAKTKFRRYMKRNDGSVENKDYMIELIDTNLMGWYSNF